MAAKRAYGGFRARMPIAATTTITANELICINVAGYIVTAADTAGYIIAGIADETVDNIKGSNGALFVWCWVGCIVAVDLDVSITEAYRGRAVYISDGSTVKASGDVLAGKMAFLDLITNDFGLVVLSANPLADLSALLLDQTTPQTVINGAPIFGEGIVLPKTSGKGIKVDSAAPTFGFADIIGDQFSKNTGATKPTLAAYNGVVKAWQFGNGDEAYMSFHIPHDYVPGTDIHLHIHWSQNAAGATGGTVDFRYTAIYAKGWNQAAGSAFTATPKTALFSSININDGGSGLNQYQQHLTEIIISAATATAALLDRDDFEPDGVIELTLEMVATNLTGTPSLPFIHFVDLHYQTNGVSGTKSREPDFYV